MASYDSDADDGDSLLDAYQHNTIATLPWQGPSPWPETYETQPTQPQRPRSPSQIQVQASSPLRSPQPPNALHSQSVGNNSAALNKQPAPHSHPTPQKWILGPAMERGALNGGILAHSMAPPGTAFRPPLSGSQVASQRARSQTAECNFSDEENGEVVRDSDDETARAKLNTGIKRTTFVRNGIPINGVNENAPAARFGHYSYSGSATVPPKRSADAMASAYGDRRQKIARQVESPKPTAVQVQPMEMGDIQDHDIRKKVTDMQSVLPSSSVRQCYSALSRCRFNYGDALDSLSEELDHEEKPVTHYKGSVDLTGSDDELQVRTIAPSLNPVKRSVANSKSIQEKWGAQARNDMQRPSNLGRTNQVKNEPQLHQERPKKRKLVRPKRQDSSPRSSSPIRAPEKPASSPGVELIDVSSDSEAAVDLPEQRSASEQKLLDFLNQCSNAELGELSTQPAEVVKQVLEKRPFEHLESVRAIAVEQTSTTKAGKSRTIVKKIGDRLVDVCLDVFESYRIVDELVAQCEGLGKPIRDEMKRCGFVSQGKGELELTDFDHDSGIGTPTSSASGDREERVGPNKKHPQRLSQPEIMSRDLTMKDYQVTGLNWLALLHSQGMSGILADDMGLGKTCQVISFLAHLLESGKSTGPHLVVVPGSTLENWLREFRNFCPALACRPYYGSQKERPDLQLAILDNLDDINVIVTTYEMATGNIHDTRFLRKLEPVICVYDEGHALKNSQSKRYKALMRIPAQFRLLLTGTPLQNNLQELVSLLAFIMPGVFQDHDEDLSLLFKAKAKTTDNSGHSALLSQQRIDRARAMMTPFILRRKKQQVLKHLPQKISSVQYCDLTPAQASMYAEQTAGLRKVLQGNDGTTSTKLKNNILMQLRKAAIHPLLFRRHFSNSMLRKMAQAYIQIADDGNKVEEIVYEDLCVMTDFELNRMCDQYPRKMLKFKFANREYTDSGKTAKLVELLHKHKKNGDRTLVFSQFTMVMDVLEKVFELEEITYSRIDGSTKMDERQDLIDQYHHDKDISVFMLSTKSGGAGINLTAANKVIIFDQDFNPQTSLQAENRAHRVGQTREVEVIRLITRGTIEEQIQALGDTKLALDQRVAGEGEGDTNSRTSQAVEEEGLEIVGRMLAESLEGKEKADVKDEFMKSLKDAGLDVSAEA